MTRSGRGRRSLESSARRTPLSPPADSGSPHSGRSGEIQAFRSFEITTEFQERYGYPALTAQAKRKILGLKAARVYEVDPEQVGPALARDPIGRIKEARGGIPMPSTATYGPRTRREMLAFLRANGGRPH
jgi:uncharacterized protein